MMKYNVNLEEVTLKEAVKLLKDGKAVFYFYINRSFGNRIIHELTKDSIITAIDNGAVFATPSSFVFSSVYVGEES